MRAVGVIFVVVCGVVVIIRLYCLALLSVIAGVAVAVGLVLALFSGFAVVSLYCLVLTSVSTTSERCF